MTDPPRGGSEHYAARLLAEMARLGARVTCLSTTTRDLAPTVGLGIRWDRDAQGVPPGIPAPRRFAPWNLPQRLHQALSTPVLAHALFSNTPALPDRGPCLGRGFWPPEIWADGGFPFRWTVDSFDIRSPGPADRLILELLAPQPLVLTATMPGWDRFAHVEPGRFLDIVLPIRRGAPVVTLHVSEIFRARGDPRPLGVAVRRVALADGPSVSAVTLADPLPPPDGDLAIANMARASGTPIRHEIAHALLRGPLSPAMLASCVRAARAADVVLAGSVPFLTMDMALLASRISRRPLALIPFLHLADPFHHSKRIYRTLAAADLVFHLNDQVRARILEPLGCKTKKLLGGIDPAELAPDRAAARARFRAELALPDGDTLALCVGRRTFGKRLDLAEKAVRAARASGRRIGMVAVGPGTEALGSEDGAVRGMGEVSRERLLDLYAASDVLLHTSEEESLGIVLLEAWGAGRPVIANRRCGALSELVRPGIDGELAADEAEWAAALCAVADDPARARAMGEAGRARVLAERSFEAAGVDAYHALLSLARGPIAA